MAGMLDTALQSGMRRNRFCELTGTGFRLAKAVSGAPAAAAIVRPGGLAPSDLLDLHGVRHLVGKFNVLVAADHDRHVAVQAGLNQYPGVGHDAGLLEAPDERDIALHVLGQLTNHHGHRVADRQLGESHQLGAVRFTAGVVQAELGQTGMGLPNGDTVGLSRTCTSRRPRPRS